MQYIEFSTSAGPGTLIEHGVAQAKRPAVPNYVDMPFAGRLLSQKLITPERYSEFIAIHGGERAV